MKRQCVVCYNLIENPEHRNCPHCGTSLAFTRTWEALPALQDVAQHDVFPPPIFEQDVIPIESLEGNAFDETTYLTIGGGLGSFVWVDHLRIWGVPVSAVTAIGLEEKPYDRFKTLCENSQIPPGERIRSDSGSCPDNIWGWPGYAVREMWRDLKQGEWSQLAGHLWQIFSEPIGADTYTPRAWQVYQSIDREAARIGWDRIWRFGRVRAIRKTSDGRYAVAYSRTTEEQSDHAIILANYVHISVGHPGSRLLPDLQDYRQRTGDFESVVNAYESHDHIYRHLEEHGGTVLLRGRGIVASRIIQRLYELRQRNPNIHVEHLLRTSQMRGQG